MKPSREIEQLCRKLKPIIGDKADRLWFMYLAEDEKGRRDLALEIETLAEKILNKLPLDIKEIILEPPTKEDAAGEFPLGNIVYNGKNLHPVALRYDDFVKQIGIFAVTGEGKTNLAFLLAIQLIRKKIPVTIIDWKRSWRNLLKLADRVPEIKNVTIFTVGRDISSFPWNPFRAPPGVDSESWISTIAEVLEKSHLSGPGVAYFFNKIYSKLLNIFKNNDFYPNFYDGERELEKAKVFDREFRWKQTALRIFHSFTVGPSKKVFNSRDPIKLETFLDKPVIFELDMEMPKPLRIFFSEIILRWIHLYRLTQGETKQLRNVLFLEEAHNLFHNSQFYKESSNSLENVYREIRGFGQGLITITQHPSMLPVYLLGNCHTQIYLGLQHEDDIRTAKKSLFLNYDEEVFLNMLKVGEAIIKIKNRINPCHVRIPLVPINGNVTDSDIKDHSRILRDLSDLHPEKGKFRDFGGIYSRHNRDDIKGKSGLDSDLKNFLIDIYKYPLSYLIQRYKRLGFNPKYGTLHKERLVKEGYVIPRNLFIGKTKRIVLFDITHKGKTVLLDLGCDVQTINEGIVHRFWKIKIADYYSKAGFRVELETPRNGKADIILYTSKKRIAVEIETGKSDYIQNILKNLKHGFDEVVSIAINKNIEAIIRKEIARNNLDKNPKIKVACVNLFDID